MADYNLWADLFDTWQSTSDWLKALAIVTPPLFVTATLAMWLRYRLKIQENALQNGGYRLLAPEPDRDGVADPAKDLLLDAAANLQARIEEARRDLQPQSPFLPITTDQTQRDIRREIARIILEEYRCQTDPAETLHRIRSFLAQRQAEDNAVSETTIEPAKSKPG